MASRDSSNQTEPAGSRFVWGGFFLLGLLGAFFAPARWESQTAVLLGVAGLLMVLFPPQVRLPRYWWLFGLGFVALSCLAFLPASLVGGFPAWRTRLEDLGVHTGSSVAVQVPQAAEMLAVFASTLVVGMWLAGHRASSGQLRFWTLAFAVGVAIYSVLSQFTRDMEFVHRTDGHFGFFPNRNHTGTYLAMGVVVGLGSFLQAIRDERPWISVLAGLSVAINLLAVVGWSISRGGVLLTGIGGLLWLVAMGPHYLGQHGRRIVALLLLVTVGGYLLADTRVKRRLEKTTEVAASVVSADPD
ncbi:MAG: O-antigen ligase protein, partial [Akkermansiaceae bacterium]|nr:O-antigen ligase protein [Akkermansiaceae bacterium]